MTLSTHSVVQQIPQETKLRDIISRSTSNNTSQTQECNLPNVLVRQSELKMNIAENKWSYLQWSLACKILNFAYGSGTFWKISLPVNVTGSRLKISKTFIFHQKMSPSRRFLLNCCQKCHQAPPGIKLTA